MQNHQTLPQTIEALYLTNGLNWKADYILLLNEKDTEADLSGWVTIDNKSGATYRHARLKLVAGDIHRVREEGLLPRVAMDGVQEAKAAPFKEESFFEYHIYSLERRTTVKDNQTKQISLLNADHIPVTKEFTYYGAQYYYRSRLGQVISNQKVGVYIQVTNSKENRLGLPLPKGTVRAYKRDPDGGLQFIGEDRIDHTPKDEKIRLRLGEAFDLRAERKQISWEKIGPDTFESSYQITIRNHKPEAVVVRVIEPLPGDWKVLENSHPYQKLNASTIVFDLPVPRDQESILRYRVRVRF